MRLARIQHGRHGLTLVEFVVVMAIIALLVALLLPATHRGREAARRTQCKNNLKQIGFALQTYHDTYQSFPAGYVLPEAGVYTGWGWSVSLLPYMDYGALYDKLNFQGGLQHEYNKINVSSVVPMFRCPTDPGSKNVPQLAVVTSSVRNGVVVPARVNAADIFPRSNYFGVVGYLPAEFGGINREDPGESQANPGRLGHTGDSVSPQGRYCDPRCFRGVFGQNSHVSFADIKDGSSNVLMVGERYTPTASSFDSVGHGTWLGVPDCSTSAGLAATLGDTSVKLNLGAKYRVDTTGFGSLLNGGSQFLLVDGSVRFLSENISIGIYRDLSTIDDGRQVGEF